jgi:hypothetical protein
MLLARLDEKNKVAELIEWPDAVDPAGAFHPSVRLVKANKATKVGAEWDGKQFSSVADVTESNLPKDELKARARKHRLVLFDTLTAKVGELESWLDQNTLSTIGHKIQLIDDGVLSQPIQFKLANGFALLSRSDLVQLLHAAARRADALFSAEAAAVEGIDKGRIKTQQQIEAAFAAKIQ